MRKKLLTAAVGAALTAGPLLTSTAIADVKLYGRVHMSVDFVDAKGTGASNAADARKNTAVSSNASRWGIDANEKLGDGLQAMAKIEQAIYADGEDNTLTSHARWVGLTGKWGTITAGIHESPFKLIGRAVELFPESIGDARNITAQGALPAANAVAHANNNSSLGWEQRPSNSVVYTTPRFNGFNLSYLYSADHTASTTVEDNRRKITTVGVTYQNGPLYAGLAYEQHQNPNNVGDATSGTAGSNEVEKGVRLGASYNFGSFKVIGLYQRITDSGGRATGDLHGINRTSWGIGGAYTAGNNVFKLQYYKAGDKNKNSATADISGEGTGAKMWAIGWDHLFSKTTKVYVAYAKTDNGANARFTVNGPAQNAHSDFVNPGEGSDPSAWSVGMIVDF